MLTQRAPITPSKPIWRAWSRLSPRLTPINGSPVLPVRCRCPEKIVLCQSPPDSARSADSAAPGAPVKARSQECAAQAPRSVDTAHNRYQGLPSCRERNPKRVLQDESLPAGVQITLAPAVQEDNPPYPIAG